MPFQVNIQVSRQLFGKIDSFTAGFDQVVLCEEIISLEAVVTGDLFGHSIEWEQIEGTPVTLSDPNSLTPTFVQTNLSNKSFRLYIDRNTSREQFDDVFIFNSPVSDFTFSGLKDGGSDRVAIQVDPVVCGTLINNDTLLPSLPPIPIESFTKTLGNPIESVITWTVPTSGKSQFIANTELFVESMPLTVSYYSGDNLSSANVGDFFKNSTGGVQGTVTTSPGVNSSDGFNIATAVDGVLLPSVFSSSIEEFSASAWCSVLDNTQKQTVLHFKDTAGTNDLEVYLEDDNIHVTGNLNASPLSHLLLSVVPTDGTFFNIVISLNESTLELFLNGISILSQPGVYSTVGFNFDEISIGNTNAFLTGMLGVIDEVRFYSQFCTEIESKIIYNQFTIKLTDDSSLQLIPVAETEEHVRLVNYEDAIKESSPVIFFPLQEKNSSIPTDVATQTTASSIDVKNASRGIASVYSYNFNGATSLVTIPSSTDFIHQTGIFSIEMWIDISDVNEDKLQYICGNIATEDASSQGFNVSYDNRLTEGSPQLLSFTLAMPTTNSTLLSSTITESINHIVVTGDGLTIKMHINNVEVDSATINALNAGLSCSQTLLGNTYDCENTQVSASTYFNGNIQGLAVFGTDLSPSTIYRHFYSRYYLSTAKYFVKTNYAIGGKDYSADSCILAVDQPLTNLTGLADDLFETVSFKHIPTNIKRFGFISKSDSDDLGMEVGIKAPGKLTRFDNIAESAEDPFTFTTSNSASTIERFSNTST